MKNIVETFHIVTVIDEDNLSYTTSGNATMDKSKIAQSTQYSKDNQTLVIESYSTCSTTLQDLIKQYLTNQIPKIRLDDSAQISYNTSGNMPVAVYMKEGSE